MKTIAYIAAAIFIFFGVLFLWGAFSPNGSPGWIVIGVISVAIGFGLIWFAGRQKASTTNQVTLKVDLPANVKMDQMTCRSCGAPLPPEAIELVAGAPVVKCPHCGTTYQLTEEPKW